MLNNTKDVLTLKELQELLHIGKNTALKLVQSGEIEAFGVGKMASDERKCCKVCQENALMIADSIRFLAQFPLAV